ncbi:hypothetical protein C8Q80DRAFT_1243861 [Daedaleopsis nitida]|nr:hypothetical protein C8Q80DRAFT_1243861 [Daedaleopsis nitida]
MELTCCSQCHTICRDSKLREGPNYRINGPWNGDSVKHDWPDPSVSESFHICQTGQSSETKDALAWMCPGHCVRNQLRRDDTCNRSTHFPMDWEPVAPPLGVTRYQRPRIVVTDLLWDRRNGIPSTVLRDVSELRYTMSLVAQVHTAPSMPSCRTRLLVTLNPPAPTPTRQQ